MGRKRRTLAYAAAPLAVGAGLLLAAAAPERFAIALWVNGEGAARQPNVVGSGSHPCGAIVVVRTASMADYPLDGIIEPELVVEREGARERRRWLVPVGYELLAVRGEELLLRHGRYRLWFSTAGGIRRERSNRGWPAPTPASCPAPASHPNSDYAACAAFRDLADNRPRLIAFETDCT